MTHLGSGNREQLALERAMFEWLGQRVRMPRDNVADVWTDQALSVLRAAGWSSSEIPREALRDEVGTLLARLPEQIGAEPKQSRQAGEITAFPVLSGAVAGERSRGVKAASVFQLHLSLVSYIWHVAMAGHQLDLDPTDMAAARRVLLKAVRQMIGWCSDDGLEGGVVEDYEA